MSMNPPAFPNLAPNSCGPHIDKRDGMTLRDYFAGQFAPVLIDKVGPVGPDLPNDNLRVARVAYAIADAMLDERERGL